MASHAAALEARPRALTARGASTRRRLLASGEEVFGRLGYHDASIAEITRGAGVGLGTFYIYFDSKRALFRALLLERGREMRATMARATIAPTARIAKERAGFAAFSAWMASHRALYRVVRQAEFVDPDLFESWYRLIGDGYAAALRQAIADGEIAPVADPETLAFCLMGMGDFVGMRWLIFEAKRRVPPRAFETMMTLVERGLTGRAAPGPPTPAAADPGRGRGRNRTVTP